MKKIVLVSLCMVILMCVCLGANAATMYSADGRTKWVDDSEIEAYEAVGWYWGKPTTITKFMTDIPWRHNGLRWYHPETGEEKYFEEATVGEKRVPEYEAVGWYWGWPTGIFNLEGKCVIIGEKRVPEYEAVGWYWGKPVTIYDKYCNSKIVGEERLDDYFEAGWTMNEPETMYSLDGRTIKVPSDQVYDYFKVGWSRFKPTSMYSIDGRKIRVFSDSDTIKEYEAVGWYWGWPTKMYAVDGRTITVGGKRVEDYRKVGWYTFKVAKITDGKGNSKIVAKSEVESWKNKGWTVVNVEPAEYEDCPTCIGGRETCRTCLGSGRVMGGEYLPGLGLTMLPQRCTATGCVNGTIDCTNSRCKGGKIRIN